MEDLCADSSLYLVLLNILIALYNSAYEDITDNAIDEYMALLSQKTMQFVRAPDENVFIARKFAFSENEALVHACNDTAKRRERIADKKNPKNSLQPDRDVLPYLAL